MRRALLVCVLALAACHHADDATTDTVAPIEPTKDAITKVTDHGPITATVTVWPAKPSLGDPIYVRLSVDSAPGEVIDVPFQEAGDQTMGRFRVVAFTRETKHESNGHLVEQQTYTVEPPGSGRQRVPPFRLTRAVPGAAGGSSTRTSTSTSTSTGTTEEILTDEIPLEIQPVKQEAIDAKMRPAAGPLDADIGDRPWWLVGLAGAILVLGSGSILLVRGLRARRQIQRKKSAYDEAVAQLRALEGRGAPTAELADTWFVELSAIVRRYLELRYDIRAPELTTEEFLQEAARAANLTPEHRTLLTSFLERCDRVKFAGYRPDAQESLDTLLAARGFVEDTRLRDEPTTPAVPAARKVA